MRTITSSIVALALAQAIAPPAMAQSAPKVVLISLDGGGERFIERMVTTGHMPNLAAIRHFGVQADYALTNFPSKTAAGHASLWTGAYGNVNGVTANEVPLLPWSEHTILEHMPGFDSQALHSEPIWSTVARSGKNAVVVQATQGTPFEVYGPGGRFGSDLTGRLTMFDAYSGQLLPETVLDSTASVHPATGWASMPQSRETPQELDLSVGDTPLQGLIYDDPADPVEGYDTLQIRPRKDSAQGAVVVKAGPSSAGSVDKFSFPVAVSVKGATASVVFRLFDLAPDLGSLRLYRTGAAADKANHPELLSDWITHTGSTIPRGAETMYAKGKLGPTLLQGGDGAAEERLLETIRLAIQNRIEKLRYASQSYPWDLLVNYMPYPDGIEHVWYGYVDATSPAYRPDIGPRLWTYMEEVAGMVDEFVGAAHTIAGKQGVVTVVSDHGMEGLAQDFYPNVILRRAGLLAVDAKGRIDLSRTKAMYSPNDGAYVILNTTDHKGGIVPPAQVPQVVERAVTALRAARNPRTHRPIITGIYQAAQADPKLGLGGPTGGDLYLDVGPGIYFEPEWDGQEILRPRPPYQSGGHVFNPARPSMHAICYMAGAGLHHGVQIPPVRTIDVAPTLCHLLGIRSPQQATGRVLTEALYETPVPVAP